jgi:hypothetical protein
LKPSTHRTVNSNFELMRILSLTMFRRRHATAGIGPSIGLLLSLPLFALTAAPARALVINTTCDRTVTSLSYAS